MPTYQPSAATITAPLLKKFTVTLYNWFIKSIPVYILLIILFAYTAFSKMDFFTNGKLIDVSHFQAAMMKSPVLQHHLNALGYTIPLTEIAICLLLLFQKTRLAGYYASLLLLCSFTGYIIYMFLTYPVLPCTCGGVISLLSWKQHLIFNIFFILLTIGAIIQTHKQPRPKTS
jgi:hypothetical protein